MKRQPKKKAIAFRSKFEKRIADQLTAKKIDFKYEPENIKYTMPESKHNYKPDFVLPNGIYIETKGKWDSDSRKKMALVKEQSDKDIRLVFMRDQPIRKGSNTYYSDVCRKLGYQFAVGTVPDEWLSEKVR